MAYFFRFAAATENEASCVAGKAAWSKKALKAALWLLRLLVRAERGREGTMGCLLQ